MRRTQANWGQQVTIVYQPMVGGLDSWVALKGLLLSGIPLRNHQQPKPPSYHLADHMHTFSKNKIESVCTFISLYFGPVSCWTLEKDDFNANVGSHQASLTIDFTRSNGFANHDTLGNRTWICHDPYGSSQQMFCCECICGILKILQQFIHSSWFEKVIMIHSGVFQMGRKLQILGSFLLGLTSFLTSSQSFFGIRKTFSWRIPLPKLLDYSYKVGPYAVVNGVINPYK